MSQNVNNDVRKDLKSLVYGIRQESKCFQDLSVVNKTRKEKWQN